MNFEFKLPDIGEGVVEGEVVRWLVQEGDQVAEDQPMVEIMTDKATVEIPSPVAGRILKRIGDEGDTISVGSTLVIIERPGEALEEEVPSAETTEAEETVTGPEEVSKPVAPPKPSAEVLATPAVRKAAREMGVDLRQVEATGSHGRVTREDLERYREPKERVEKEAPGTVARPKSLEEEEQTIPYRGLRRKIGAHMALSKSTAAHYTYVEEVDATELVALRRRFIEMNKEQGSRLTYLPFLIKAVAQGLRQYPLLNSTLDEEAGLIRIRSRHNIGIATATREGLVVPVVKDVDQKNILELAQEIAELSEAARQGKLSLEDLRDSTFTITSLGAMGGLMATPVINYPEVAILGVHKINARPVVRDDEIVIRQMMNLSLSLDHRVVDGVIGAQFMHAVIPLIESPGLMLMA